MERLEDRSLLATAALVGSELQITFTATGTTEEWVGIQTTDTQITFFTGIAAAPSFDKSLVNRITVRDVGGSTNQQLSFGGGGSFGAPASVVLSDGFSSTGVERFIHNGSLRTTGAGTISVDAAWIQVGDGIGGRSMITENGGITLSGSGTPTPIPGVAGVSVFGLVETIGTGSVSIVGKHSTGVGVSLTFGGIVRSSSSANTPTQGTITIHGTGGSGASLNRGVVVNPFSPAGGVVSNSGSIWIVGQGGNPGNGNDGVLIGGVGNVSAANQGSIEIRGTSGGGGSSSGVAINLGAGPPGTQVRSEHGGILIRGVGGASASSLTEPGVRISEAGRPSVVSGTGEIRIEGVGGASTGGDHGIAIGSGSVAVTSASGEITLQGVAGTGAGSFAVELANSSFGTVVSGPVLHVLGDTFNFAGNGFVGAGSVNFVPLTPGTTIGVGGGDQLTGTKRLGLNANEISRIFAATFTIGDAASGTISVDSAVNTPVNKATDFHFLTAGDIVFFAPFSTVGTFTTGAPTRGNLLLSPGALGSVQPKFSATDVTTANTGGIFTTSFAAGSDLAINIAGLTPNTQYDRLTALGGVNVTGADLQLTGGFASNTGNVFTIVSATTLTGIFNGLPENSHVIFNGRLLRVNYTATTATLTDIGPAPSIDLAGRVFDDRDNDGVFNGSDAGIANVAVQLYDETNLSVPLATVFTAADGTYLFDADLSVGSYRIVASQPVGLLDGKETAGGLGGSVNNAADSNAIQGIIVGLDSGIAVADGYHFADIRPARVQGLVWEDANNNGEVDFGEQAIDGVSIRLTGADDRGAAVDLIMQTDSQGLFEFLDLRPSDSSGYVLIETQPQGVVDGPEVVGTVNGITTGSSAANDVISQIVMGQPGSDAINYNFAELPAVSGGLQAGQTAGIAFWQNKNGQALIKSLNGGPSATQLANWLAATFPNLYGASAGANNLAGMTNAEVAGFYQTLFKRNAKTAAGSGPPKVDAQVLAVALAVYVTNENLASTVATDYGFVVDSFGAGAATFNVGDSGAAFGVADGSEVRILDLLLTVNSRSTNGMLYDLNGDGDTDDTDEALFRTMANDFFSAINEVGGS